LTSRLLNGKMGGMRGKCNLPDCNNLQRNRGKTKAGKTIWGNLCWTHHRLKYNMSLGGKQWIKNKKCELCGWDKGPCDRHRIDGKKGYSKQNVKILCPNCHRLVTLGVIKLQT